MAPSSKLKRPASRGASDGGKFLSLPSLKSLWKKRKVAMLVLGLTSTLLISMTLVFWNPELETVHGPSDKDLDYLPLVKDEVASWKPLLLRPAQAYSSKRQVYEQDWSWFNVDPYRDLDWLQINFVEQDNTLAFCTKYFEEETETEDLLPKPQNSTKNDWLPEWLMSNFDRFPVLWDAPISAVVATLRGNDQPCIVAPSIDWLAWESGMQMKRALGSGYSKFIGSCEHIHNDDTDTQVLVEATNSIQTLCFEDRKRTDQLSNAHIPKILWTADAHPFPLPVLIAFENALVTITGAIVSEGVIFKPLGSCFSKSELMTDPKQSLRDKIKLAPSSKENKVAKLFSLATPWTLDSFHTPLNSVTRIGAYLKELLNDPSIHLLIPHTHEFNPATVLLEVLGFQPERLISSETSIYSSTVFVPSSNYGCHTPTGPFHTWSIREAMWTALRLVVDDDTDADSVIVTGRKTPLRQHVVVMTQTRGAVQVLNFAQVMNNLSEMFPDQRFLPLGEPKKRSELIYLWQSIARAKAIIGPSASNLAHIILAAPGTPILEFLPPDLPDLYHMRLAKEMGLPYTGAFVDRSTTDGGVQIQTDFIVNWLREALQLEFAGT